MEKGWGQATSNQHTVDVRKGAWDRIVSARASRASTPGISAICRRAFRCKDCQRLDDLSFLYVGIASKAPPKNGARPSKQNLFGPRPLSLSRNGRRLHAQTHARLSTRVESSRIPRSVQLGNKSCCRSASDTRFSALRVSYDFTVANEHQTNA